MPMMLSLLSLQYAVMATRESVMLLVSHTTAII